VNDFRVVVQVETGSAPQASRVNEEAARQSWASRQLQNQETAQEQVKRVMGDIEVAWYGGSRGLLKDLLAMVVERVEIRIDQSAVWLRNFFPQHAGMRVKDHSALTVQFRQTYTTRTLGKNHLG
jgi:hypothetical protein